MSVLLSVDEWRLTRTSRASLAGRPPVSQADVLLVGLSIDPHLEAIALETTRRGATVSCVHVDVDFAGGLNLTYSPDQPTCTVRGALLRTIDLERPVLHHGRRAAVVVDPYDHRGVAHDFQHREAAASLDGWLAGVDAPRWINDVASVRRSAPKLAQLRAARQAGLSVPDTLVTADVAAARAFVAEHGVAVTKPIAGPVVWCTDTIAGIAHTQELAATDLDRVGGAGLGGPTMLQARINRRYEYRAVVIDGTVKTFRVFAPPEYLDWRRSLADGTALVEPCSLEPQIESAVAAVVSALGLGFAAVDLIEDMDGRVWFLETNADGSFLWLEAMTGATITAAVVDALLRSTT